MTSHNSVCWRPSGWLSRRHRDGFMLCPGNKNHTCTPDKNTHLNPWGLLIISPSLFLFFSALSLSILPFVSLLLLYFLLTLTNAQTYPRSLSLSLSLSLALSLSRALSCSLSLVPLESPRHAGDLWVQSLCASVQCCSTGWQMQRSGQLPLSSYWKIDVTIYRSTQINPSEKRLHSPQMTPPQGTKAQNIIF